MKRRTVLMLVFLLLLMAADAAASHGKPLVKADKTYFDVNSGLNILKGHVYIEFRDQIITAGLARANMTTMEIWGADGVTLTSGDIILTAAGVRVVSQESRAVIEGDVVFKRANITIAADKADFNWGTRLSRFSGRVRVNDDGNTWSADSLTYNIDTNTLQ